MKKELEVTNRVAKEELNYKKKPSFKRTCQNSVKKVKYNFGKNKNNSIMKTALIIGSTD
jgi:hypothetical protein